MNEGFVVRIMFVVQKLCNAKEVCNRALTYQPALARKSGESILVFGSKIDIYSVNKNFCLPPAVKIVRSKNVANDLNINLAL